MKNFILATVFCFTCSTAFASGHCSGGSCLLNAPRRVVSSTVNVARAAVATVSVPVKVLGTVSDSVKSRVVNRRTRRVCR